jgi:type II secretory pathway pseudopilin PulG
MRGGFTMITVLWVMTVASVVAAAGALAGRNAVSATRNRTELERARWTAQGCAAVVRADVDDVLANAPTYEDAAMSWRVLPRLASQYAAPTACHVDLTAAGTRLDINVASADMLDSALEQVGQSPDAATAIAASVVQWRADDAPVASIYELARFGVRDDSGLDSLLWAEPGRISLATASVAVLTLVPGITRETAERVAALRDAGTPVTEIADVFGEVSDASADEAMMHYSEIVQLTTADPEAWILTVSSSSGFPSNAATVEWRLVRAGKRTIVVRSRTIY